MGSTSTRLFSPFPIILIHLFRVTWVCWPTTRLPSLSTWLCLWNKNDYFVVGGQIYTDHIYCKHSVTGLLEDMWDHDWWCGLYFFNPVAFCLKQYQGCLVHLGLHFLCRIHLIIKPSPLPLRHSVKNVSSEADKIWKWKHTSPLPHRTSQISAKKKKRYK